MIFGKFRKCILARKKIDFFPDILHMPPKSMRISPRFFLFARNLGDERTGYFTFNSNEGLREIVFGNSLFSNLRLAADGTSVVYTEERYDLPTQLIYKNLSSKASSILFRSNPQHFEDEDHRKITQPIRPDPLSDLNINPCY